MCYTIDSPVIKIYTKTWFYIVTKYNALEIANIFKDFK